MRVYVAGSSRELDRARWAMDAVRALGCTLTLDWLACVAKHPDPNEGLDDETRRAESANALDGVRHADVVWLLAPSEVTRGAWVELGYAIASGCTVIVSGPESRRSIFCALATAEVTSDADALALIEGLVTT